MRPCSRDFSDSSERFQEAPELAQAAVQGGGSQARHDGEQVREEPLDVAQEGALALDSPELLEQGEGQHLGVRELLERLVASAPGGEASV